MAMTNLGITKEEIIYQLVLRISTVEVWHVEPFDIVHKATKIYDELVNKNIIKEKDSYYQSLEHLKKAAELTCNTRGGVQAHDNSVKIETADDILKALGLKDWREY